MVRNRMLKSILAGCVCAMALAGAAAAQNRDWNVPGGDLKAALDAYVHQSGRQIVYNMDEVRGVPTAGAQGNLSSEDALARILRGTPFRIHRDPSGAVGLVRAEGGAAQGDADEPPVSTLDEVIVTARKRAETLQDVPMAVSVFSGAQLEAASIDDANDLYGRVPGLYFTAAGGAAPTSDFTYLVFRGVGSNGGQEPAAGVFIDGMYQPQLGFDIGFLNLERLEVLRGPQGTLFGRNTEGGALNLVTRKPGRDLEGRVEAEVASFDTARAFASVAGPLSESLSAGLTAEHATTEGYVNNPFTGKPTAPDRRTSVRGVLRFNPGDQLDIVLSADASRRSGNEIGIGAQLACDCYDVYADNDARDTKENAGVQLNADWKFGPGLTFTSITGYRTVESDITLDFDAMPTGQAVFVANGRPGSRVAPGPITLQGLYQRTTVEQKFLSQEFRLAGASDRLDWLVGAYAFGQDQVQTRDFSIGPGTTRDAAVAYLVPTAIKEYFTTERTGWALFGQASWRPTDRIEVTGGLRYSDESVKIGGERIRNIVSIENANPTFFMLDGEKSFSDLSWMGSVSFEISNEAKTYFTVAKGWKAGGFNRFPSNLRAALPYDSETAISYELGLKGAAFDRRLTANLAAFYIDIDGQQLLTVTPDPLGIPVTTIANAGQSRSKGFEAEVVLRPTDGLKLSAAATYTHARFVSFSQCAAAGVCISRDGTPFDYTPEVTASLTAEYTLPVGADYDVDLYANWRYVDGYQVPNGSFLAPLGGTAQVPSYDRLDLRATLRRDAWRVTAYVENVLDSLDYDIVSPQAFVATTPGALYGSPMAPRTWGLVAGWRF